ncbi:glycolate oxidase FAD binding subunit [Paraburkholderia sp. GAS199]|uniref:glycolate oxidase subunit GlcE n=1 Tax=Paraburkholderia sp. GAS199 TaxID=3035126 RepID=UPI003D1C2C27
MIESYREVSPQRTVRPDSADELAQIVSEANEAGESFEIVGGATKRSFGDAVRSERRIEMSALSGIELYEPDELVIKAAAGTALATIDAALAEHGQFLPFDPPDYAALYGAPDGASTLGGVIGSNLSGPRRILSGSARDAVLGIEAINGRGERFKAGGRTIKNVTGFDISRLMAGSFGTLAILTSVTLKVLPVPQSELTLRVANLPDHDAIVCLSALLGLPFEISAAAHLGGAHAGARTTAVRIDGFTGSVAGRAEAIGKRLQTYGAVEKLEGEESRKFWRSVRDLTDFSADTQTCIWRLALPCDKAAAIVDMLESPALYDWGGSRVFVRTSADEALAHGQTLRSRIAASGGTASLLRAPLEVRQTLGTFQPRSATLNRLNGNVRAAFDPNAVLNPGKLASLDAGH